MEFNDNILNVYGLLRMKSSQNLAKTLQIATELEKDKLELHDLTVGIDELESQIKLLTKTYGLDIQILDTHFSRDRKADDVKKTPHGLKVEIDSDYDYEAAFARLTKEADKAGYKNVRPEDLLSEEDMKRVAEKSRNIDARFEDETGLRLKDIGILIIASAIKIFFFYLNNYIFSKAETTKKHEADIGNCIPIDVQVPSYDAIVSKIRAEKSKIVHVLDKKTILTEPIPFDVEDNSFFSRQDVIGYDPLMGWLFGTINFMTNTVTTNKLNSYSVVNSENGHVVLGERLSTPVHILFPIAYDIKRNKDSIVAATIREAEVLNVSHSSYQTMASLMETIIEEIEQFKGLISYGQTLNSFNVIDISQIAKNTALLTFDDMLTAAVCSVAYTPDSDGDVSYYAIRMHKVLLISNAFTAIANNIPSTISGDISQVDFSSIINALSSLFHSTKYWTDIKSQYLVSEHKKIIDEQMKEVDKYLIAKD